MSFMPNMRKLRLFFVNRVALLELIFLVMRYWPALIPGDTLFRGGILPPPCVSLQVQLVLRKFTSKRSISHSIRTSAAGPGHQSMHAQL